MDQAAIPENLVVQPLSYAPGGAARSRWKRCYASPELSLLMLKIVNRILWFVQVVGLCIPPIDLPGFRKGSHPGEAR